MHHPDDPDCKAPQPQGNNSSRGTNPKKEKCKQPATADSPAKMLNGPCPGDTVKCDPSDPNCAPGQSAGSGSGGVAGSGGGGGFAGGGSGGGGSTSAGGGVSGGGANPAPPRAVTELLYMVDAAWLHWAPNQQPAWKPGLGALASNWWIAGHMLSASVASAQSASPSADYREVALPAVEPVAPPANSSDVARAGFEAVNAIRSEAADVQAFGTNYSRYLGAKQANDAQAELKLANALVQLSDRAMQEANSAASATAHFDQVLAPIAREVLDRMNQQGATWDGDVAALKASASGGLPKAVENEIAATGATRDQIASFTASTSYMSAEQLKSAIDELAKPSTAVAANNGTPQQRAVEDLRALAARLQAEAQQSVRTGAAAAADAKPQSIVSVKTLAMIAVLAVIAGGSFLVGVRGARAQRGPGGL